jgi:hypothetical protein
MGGNVADPSRRHDPQVRNRLMNVSTVQGLVTDEAAGTTCRSAAADRTYVVMWRAGSARSGLVPTMSKLREHLERRDPCRQRDRVRGRANKYAPADGPDRAQVGISERGRYLGLVLFGAQQFRSQVHRRVVGNAGTTVYGRMDGDELATPGYQTLSPATKGKLATLPKGELMIRHPHFTQPVFLRFPRPAALAGRQGVERYPPAADVPFADAVVRQLPGLARRVAPQRVVA